MRFGRSFVNSLYKWRPETFVPNCHHHPYQQHHDHHPSLSLVIAIVLCCINCIVLIVIVLYCIALFCLPISLLFFMIFLFLFVGDVLVCAFRPQGSVQQQSSIMVWTLCACPFCQRLMCVLARKPNVEDVFG